ncbi:MAG: hypothetical protein Q4C74_01255 [Rothia sp. (in: high G+C Gram-positive bacteria)]|nr:hypothetical protein [Rothia sp. (in: high G+C Gram-positive bacteria)]
MSWWFWVLLWLCLLLVSFGFLGWLLYRVILKGARTYGEFLRFTEGFADLWDQAMASHTQQISSKQQGGIFVPISQAYAQYEQGKKERENDRISRRILKRDLLGQPQRLGDLRYNARKGSSHG